MPLSMFPMKYATKWVAKNYPLENANVQKKMESHFVGTSVIGFLTVFYVLSQYRPDMDTKYLIYFIGHCITASVLIASFILLILHHRKLAIWVLYMFFFSTGLTSLIVTGLADEGYYFYMFNFILAQATLLMFYLYLNIIAIEPIHRKASLIGFIGESVIITIYYVYVGQGENTLNILSVFLPLLLGFAINVIVISSLHHWQIDELTANQEQIEMLLGKSKDRVKKLEQILPICSICHTIRNDEDEWIQLEEYVHQKSDLEFSHSICPKCAKEHYGDFLD